jgi:cytochrome c oxidase subunit 2
VKSLKTGITSSIAALSASLIGIGGVQAAEVVGAPRPWQMDFQPAVTPVMRDVVSFHNGLLVLITLITIFVLGLMVYVMWRFNEKRNPTPSTTTHNTMIEVLWTIIPVIILIGVAIPSFKLLYFSDVVPKADLTIKTIGHQWYWSYEYPDHGKFSFDSVMIADEDIKPGQIRLLDVDNRIVVPVNKTVRVIVTADSVIHAWAIPAFGIKLDAVPGRLNETWFRAEREGIYYGQCSELCGVNHGFMPIRVDVVSESEFASWIKKAQKKYAADGDAAPEQKLAQTLKSTR